jgi:predicted sulfurtransferase
MAAPTYKTQLSQAQEALAAIVSGQLESHSTLAGQFRHLSIEQLRDHIEWLEMKAQQEEAGGRRFVAFTGGGLRC